MVALLLRKPPFEIERSCSIAQTCFVSYRCIGTLFHVSGHCSHISHFLIGSFISLSLRGSRRTAQTNIQYVHSFVIYIVSNTTTRDRRTSSVRSRPQSKFLTFTKLHLHLQYISNFFGQCVYCAAAASSFSTRSRSSIVSRTVSSHLM